MIKLEEEGSNIKIEILITHPGKSSLPGFLNMKMEKNIMQQIKVS